MRSFFRIALLGLPLVGSVVAEGPASPTRETAKETHPIYANAEQAFQDLLNALPEESLHVALNGLTHFKDGVFESDRHGVERVHHENPPLATKLIVAAVQDLKKRQAPQPRQAPTNGTETVAPPASTSQAPSSQAPTSQPPPSSQAPTSQAPPSSKAPSSAPPPESSKESAVLVPVPITTTNSAGSTIVASSAILSQPTASVAVEITRTNAQAGIADGRCGPEQGVGGCGCRRGCWWVGGFVDMSLRKRWNY
ncbi:hypothetical protein BCR34DRAFT_61432 [Clohesyomyces aquaticus]|uniref:Uncharacterized protein n=1 Tax=Clohesyomyces aquaticus TaxID=1231657 RepID=A0A1Y2A3L6_9PLEO|nr:hypothetical protein BCR34DRAFT_61432 [Clohesyomyces aquaticus]